MRRNRNTHSKKVAFISKDCIDAKCIYVQGMFAADSKEEMLVAENDCLQAIDSKCSSI